MNVIKPNGDFFEDRLPLPFDIRYALRYKEATLDSDDIGTLFNSRFSRFGFMILMKACEDNENAQIDLLKLACSREGNISGLSLTDVEPILESNPSISADGTKIALISRHGMSNWLERYEATLQVHASESQQLFALANSTLVAFDILYKHSIERDQSLSILKPSSIEQGKAIVGFHIGQSATGLTFDVLTRDFNRPTGAVILDDVMRTGSTRDAVLDFWSNDSNLQPDFVAVGITSVL
ncbi:hypothetical protein KDA00_02520 [Candidatus Saccharibacteria bacterium]|nr:hypothetical protein [Candidatus Saccharibacteria bacterium]